MRKFLRKNTANKLGNVRRWRVLRCRGKQQKKPTPFGHSIGWLITDWLTNCLRERWLTIDWLTNWLPFWLIDWRTVSVRPSVRLSIRESVGRPVSRSVGWSVGQSVHSSVHQSSHQSVSLSLCLTYWLIEYNYSILTAKRAKFSAVILCYLQLHKTHCHERKTMYCSVKMRTKTAMELWLWPLVMKDLFHGI